MGDLLYTLRTGEPADEHTHGKSRWQKLAEDHEASRDFNAAMAEATTRVAGVLIDVYDFSGVRVVADIAGGTGALLSAVLRAHPDIRGILFDLPAGLV